MSTLATTTLEIEALHVSLGGTPIVRDVSFAAKAGQVTVIVGPNGSGKSTTLKAVTGELPHSGRVRLNGVEVDDLPPEALAGLRAVLPQHASLTFPLTVAEVVRLGIRRGVLPAGSPHRRIAEALERVDLDGFAAREYHSLSGGEQQRVQLARVLCQVWEPCPDGVPRWLFLDEPISSLDIRHQILIMDVAADYARAGGGVVAVLHDLNLTALYADHILVMKSGRLLSQGTPKEVITDRLVSEAFDHPLRVSAVPAGEIPFILPQAAGPAAAVR